jgi:dTDP-4-dehydrorhamnose reductase
MSERILVFGGSGMLGKRVVKALLGRGHTVTAHSHSATPIDGFLRVDVALGAARPAVIINCAGVIPERGLADETMIAVNAVAPHVIARAAKQRGGIPIIHISTDCVFDGAPALWGPRSIYQLPTAKNIYGQSKALGEVDAPHVTNVRTSFVGPEHGLWAWLAARDGGSVDGWTQALWSGSTVDAVAEAIADMAEHPPGGTVHLATAEPMSKYKVLLALRAHLDLKVTITPVDYPVIDRRLSPTVTLLSLAEALAALPQAVRS